MMTMMSTQTAKSTRSFLNGCSIITLLASYRGSEMPIIHSYLTHEPNTEKLVVEMASIMPMYAFPCNGASE